MYDATVARPLIFTQQGDVRRPAVFLDRDGTLNEDTHYLHKEEDWRWIAKAPEALLALAQAGFALVVITNQSGIARGYYDEAALHQLHHFVQKDLLSRVKILPNSQAFTGIDAFYHCPHHPQFGNPPTSCACRKPHPALLQRAAAELHLDLDRSWMVGDKVSDVAAGLAAGCQSILVLTGSGKEERARLMGPLGTTPCLPSVQEAAAYILAN